VKLNDREQRIRERAHAIWLEEGEPAGEHERHWEAACREIDAQAAASADTDGTPEAQTAASAGAEVAPAPQEQSAPAAAVANAATPLEPVATANEATAPAAKGKRARRVKTASAAAPGKRKPGGTKA
jgi:hypothetical protein